MSADRLLSVLNTWRHIFVGDIIRWEQQVRFRHLTTRLYLCMDSDMQVSLTPDPKDPNTVFRLHPIIKVIISYPFRYWSF